MSLFQQPNLCFIRNQMVSVNDMEIEWLLAANDIWAEYGMAAASVYMFGA